MNKTEILSIVLLFISATTLAQPNCNGGRYHDDTFQNVTVYSAITYGQNTDVNGNLVTLKLDFYKPEGDTVTNRPLLLFAFGGSFVFGTRLSPDIVTLCNSFAKKGYACASIDYRLGLSPGGLSITAENVKNAILRATHDMRAAVRFMKSNAGVDSLGIDTAHIIVGGVSAGGFAALHTAYMDEASEIPAEMDTTIEGGVEGYSGNPGFSSQPWAVVNLCGALIDTSWLHAGDQPLVTLQGNNDGSVPYCYDEEQVFGNPIAGMFVSGGNPLERRATNQGLTTGFYTWGGADHTPFVLGTQTTEYMDTTVNYIRDFLSNLLCSTSFSYQWDSLQEQACNPTSSSVEENVQHNIEIYPNPVNDVLVIENNSRDTKSCVLKDINGKIVLNYILLGNEISKTVISNLPHGIYFLHVESENNTEYHKVLKQ